MKSKRRFFDFPDIYDIALRAPYERIETAVNCIRWLIARRGIAKGRILELACGICTHGILLAQALSIIGIDISQRMLDGAKHRA